MHLVLVRIDDRLIHGQVVVGWGNYLRPDRILLCSNNIANSPWEKELYASAVTIAPYNLKVSVLTEDETVRCLKTEAFGKEKVMLLVESPKVLVNLIERGITINNVNVGGMHFRRGKRQVTPFIFVDDDDILSFKKLKQMNIKLEGRDVPTSRKINLTKFVDQL